MCSSHTQNKSFNTKGILKKKNFKSLSSNVMGSVVGKIREERPEYTVRSSVDGEYEIRVYKPNIAIETPVSGMGSKENDSAPFMKLAGFHGICLFLQSQQNFMIIADFF